MSEPSLRVITAGSFYNLIRNHSDLFYNQQQVLDLKPGDGITLIVERKDKTEQRRGFWVHLPDERFVQPDGYEQVPYWTRATAADLTILSGADELEIQKPTTRASAGRYAFFLYREEQPKTYSVTSLQNVIPYSLFTVQVPQVDETVFAASGVPLLLSVPELFVEKKKYNYEWIRVRMPDSTGPQDLSLALLNADPPQAGKRYESWDKVRTEYIDVTYAALPETTRYVMYLELLSVYNPSLVEVIDGTNSRLLVAQNMQPGSSVFLCYRYDTRDSYELAGQFEVHIAPLSLVTENSGLPQRRVESLFQEFLDSQETRGRHATLQKVFRPNIADVELYPPIRESLRDTIFPAWEAEYLALQARATTGRGGVRTYEDKLYASDNTSEKKRIQLQRLKAANFFEAQQWLIRRPAQYTENDNVEVSTGSVGTGGEIRWYTVFIPDGSDQLATSDSYALILQVLQTLNTPSIAAQLLDLGSTRMPVIQPDRLEALPTNSYFICLAFEVYNGADKLLDKSLAYAAPLNYDRSSFSDAFRRPQDKLNLKFGLRDLKRIALLRIDFSSQRALSQAIVPTEHHHQLKAEVKEAVRHVYKHLNVYAPIFARVIENRATAKQFLSENMIRHKISLADLLDKLEQATDNRELARAYQLFKSATGTDAYWVKPDEKAFRPVIPMRFGEQIKLYKTNAAGITEEGASWLAQCFSQPADYTPEQFVRDTSNAMVLFRIYRTIKKQLRIAQEAVPLATNFRAYASSDPWIQAELAERFSRGLIRGETIDSVPFRDLLRWMMLSVRSPNEFLDENEQYPFGRVDFDTAADSEQYLERASIGESLWYDYNRDPLSLQPLYKVEKAKGGLIVIPPSGPRADDTFGGTELQTQVYAIQQALQPDNLISALLGNDLSLDQLVDLSTFNGSSLNLRQKSWFRGKHAIGWVADIIHVANLPIQERITSYVKIVSQNISNVLLEVANPEPTHQQHFVPSAQELRVVDPKTETALLLNEVRTELENSTALYHQLNYYQNYSNQIKAIRTYLVYALSDLIDLYIALMVKALVPSEYAALGLKDTTDKIKAYPNQDPAWVYTYSPANPRQTTLSADVRAEISRIKEIVYSTKVTTALGNAILAGSSVPTSANLGAALVKDLKELETQTAAAKKANLSNAARISRLAAGIEDPKQFLVDKWLNDFDYERYVQEQTGVQGSQIFDLMRRWILFDPGSSKFPDHHLTYSELWILARADADLSASKEDVSGRFGFGKTKSLSIIGADPAKRSLLSVEDTNVKADVTKFITDNFGGRKVVVLSQYQTDIARSMKHEAITIARSGSSLPSTVITAAFTNAVSTWENKNKETLRAFATELAESSANLIWRQYWPLQKLPFSKTGTKSLIAALYHYLELPDANHTLWVGEDNEQPKITDVSSVLELQSRVGPSLSEQDVTTFVQRKLRIPILQPFRITELILALNSNLSLSLENPFTWELFAALLLPARLQRIVIRLSSNEYIAVGRTADGAKWIFDRDELDSATLLRNASLRDYWVLFLPDFALTTFNGISQVTLNVAKPPITPDAYLASTYSSARKDFALPLEEESSNQQPLAMALNAGVSNKINTIIADTSIPEKEQTQQIQDAMQQAAESYALLAGSEEEPHMVALFNAKLASAAYESELNVVKDSLKDIFAF